MPTELSHDTENDVSDTLLERLRQATAGTYDIAGILGRGGMAVVFVAEDLRLRRTVAIKVMEPSLSLIPGMAERFLAEARTLAKLQHPNVIVVHDVQRSKGLNFFVMTLIEGGGVDELCRDAKPLPIDQAQWILLGAARALAFAHSEQIIHRDVKPANILVNVKGDVVLTDFGIAKGVDGTGLTKSGTQIGTPVYMSPEQFTGEAIGPASDQYALGITAYQLLTGSPPFSGELYALIAAHGTRIPAPIRQLRPDCPAYLANAVMRMLEKRPHERWPSLDDLSDVFAANLPSDGGATRKQLASAARALHLERRQAVEALDAQPPLSPVPTHAPRTTPRAAPNLVVTVSPPAATIFVGGSLELRASVTLENGQPVTDAAVSWTSSEPGHVSVDAVGRLTGVAPGKAAVRATLDGGFSEAQITIEAAPIARLSLPITEVTLPVGDRWQPAVAAIDVTGSTRSDVALSWSSRSTQIADLETTGVIRALSPGRAVIEVAYGNLRQRIDVTVVPRPITRVSIRPGPPSLELGATRQLVLDAFDDRGDAATAAAPQWRSSAPAVIHLDSMGRALAISRGAARISVTIDGVTDAIDLVAVESPVAALAVQIESLRPEVGDDIAIHLAVTDTTGGLRSAETVRVWSSDASIAVVDELRMVLRAVAPGAVNIYAQSIVDGVPGVSATQPVLVRAPAAARLIADPAQIDLEEGATTAVRIRALDRRGQVVTAPDVVWTSDSPLIATVGSDGVVRGLAIGSGMISARVTSPEDVSVETRVPVLVRPNRSVAAAPELPMLRTPLAPTVPLPRPVSATDALGVPPLAPTVPLPRPVSATDALGVPPLAPTVPLPRPERAAAEPPSRYDAGHADLTPALRDETGIGSASVPTDPKGVAVRPIQASGAAGGDARVERSRSRHLLIGAGALVAVVGVWALTKSVAPAPTPSATTSVFAAPPEPPAPVDRGANAPGESANPKPDDRAVPQGDVGAPRNNGSGSKSAPVAQAADSAARKRGAADVASPRKPGSSGQIGTGSAGPAAPQPPSAAAEPVGSPAREKPPTVTPIPEPSVPAAAARKVPADATPAPTVQSAPRRAEPATIAEAPDAGELRNQAERFTARLRAGAERNAELIAFFSDGDDHEVVVVKAPSAGGTNGGRTEAQFEIRLTKFDAGGRRVTRFATVTMDVVKRDGSVSTTSTSIGALRSRR